MTIYIASAVFPVFLGVFFPKLSEDKRQKRLFYIICGTVLLLVMGLRHYSLGSTDTLNYYDTMRRALASATWASFYDADSYEIGSQFLIFVLSRIFKDPQWLLVITSIIYIISIFYFVEHNSEDIPLSITLYVTLGLMTFHLQGMRQSIAMSICLFAYEQAKNKHLVRFLLLVALATAFHQTAIVFLPVYILCRMKFSKKSIFIMCAIAVIAVINADKIIQIANAIFHRSYTTSVDQGGFVAVLIYAIILILTLVFDDSLKNGNEQTPLLFILILGFICYIMRYFGTLAAERISFYFAFSQLALLPNSKFVVLKKEQTVMRLLIILLSVALMAYRLHGSEFVPYLFYWQN